MTQRISFYCADAVGGREQEPNMSLLFWYLPFIILSGAYELVFARRRKREAGVSGATMEMH